MYRPVTSWQAAGTVCKCTTHTHPLLTWLYLAYIGYASRSTLTAVFKVSFIMLTWLLDRHIRRRRSRELRAWERLMSIMLTCADQLAMSCVGATINSNQD